MDQGRLQKNISISAQKRQKVENLLKRRYFVNPSFEIYGGAAGFFDLGPPGSALKVEIESLWRRHFIVSDEMLELTATCLTPHKVLQASGHVDRFTDLLIRDLVTDESFRADKYLEDVLEGKISRVTTKSKNNNQLKVNDSIKSSDQSVSEDKKLVSDINKRAVFKNNANQNTKEAPVVMNELFAKVEELTEERKQEIIRLAGSMSAAELSSVFKSLEITSPAGNELSEPYPFNLMFETKVGAPVYHKNITVGASDSGTCSTNKLNEGTTVITTNRSKKNAAGAAEEDHIISTSTCNSDTAFLRPETAQGIFVNFRRLLDYNRGKIPFGTAQLGIAFRNEISPRNGLLRVREFPMAEIEYFVHPQRKEHSKFSLIEHMKLPLYSRAEQIIGANARRDLSVREAVENNIINNQSLGYFLARTFIFLTMCGIEERYIRFRQHLATEMAHYASDCWDAEVETVYGWIEVAGHADRAAYDLAAHADVTKIPLTASVKYEIPVKVEYVKYLPNKSAIGKTFKKDQERVNKCIEGLSNEEKMKIEENLTCNGYYDLIVSENNDQTFRISREMMKFELSSKYISEETFIPHVIEPSFGIGRILHCILEQTFREREIIKSQKNEDRHYFAFPAVIAPIKCSVLTISSNISFQPLVDTLCKECQNRGISFKTDSSSATIGKRYARTDELGIPFGVTIDFQSLSDETVTLRERDTMGQVRLKVKEVVGVIESLIRGLLTWSDVLKTFPVFVEQDIGVEEVDATDEKREV